MFDFKKIILLLSKKKNRENFSSEKQIEEEKIGLRVHGLTLIITGLLSLTMLISIQFFNNRFSKNKGDSETPTSEPMQNGVQDDEDVVPVPTRQQIQLKYDETEDTEADQDQANYQMNLNRLYYILIALSIILSFSGLVMILHSYSDTQNQVKILVSPIFYTGFIAMLYFGVKFLLEEEDNTKNKGRVLIGLSIIPLAVAIGIQAGFGDKITEIKKDEDDKITEIKKDEDDKITEI